MASTAGPPREASHEHGMDGPPTAPWELTHDAWPGEARLPSRPESAGVARRLVRSMLHHRWGLPPDVTDTAVLLTSELVGNAVQHAGAHVFGLRIRRRRDWIRCEVRDPSRALPCRLPVRDLDVSGRGLHLVNMLAGRWGVDLLPHGKSTWFEMRVPGRTCT
ncbi:ATP-binding protein [Streptomyces sp. 7-21]|jgi:anti-sigma regulatory factor (Ser/Thr protein kinase)|uniref:ATP-binding protein n=1 Tax=Streptomyces sp. 7-21 TaxID=2802283 RepID=UPI00191CCC4C|nr:ATP-binding protein [Streptomyces sp. 7-21]